MPDRGEQRVGAECAAQLLVLDQAADALGWRGDPARGDQQAVVPVGPGADQPVVEVADADTVGNGEERLLTLPEHAHDLDVARPREVPGEVENGSDRAAHAVGVQQQDAHLVAVGRRRRPGALPVTRLQGPKECPRDDAT
ncbi:hypothetical protein GCM10023075_27300 [Streptosporangium album]